MIEACLAVQFDRPFEDKHHIVSIQDIVLVDEDGNRFTLDFLRCHECERTDDHTEMVYFLTRYNTEYATDPKEIPWDKTLRLDEVGISDFSHDGHEINVVAVKYFRLIHGYPCDKAKINME